MSVIGKFRKEEWERKRYTIDYTDWLDVGEVVESISFSSTPMDTDPAQVDTFLILNPALLVQIFVSGGLPDTRYSIDVRMITSYGQRKEDQITFDVAA